MHTRSDPHVAELDDMHPTMDLLTQGTVDIWHIDASTAANLSRFCSKLLSSDEIHVRTGSTLKGIESVSSLYTRP
jgi:hypothetical protein